MSTKDEVFDLTMPVAQIVAAYVSHNLMPTSDIPAFVFVQLVRRSLIGISSEKPYFLTGASNPPVFIEDSIQPDYIICLEDGKHLKMLKRHLKTAYHMTPEQYRKRWSLPIDYSMVAPNYSQRRSNIAKSVGLGTHQSKGNRKAAA